MSESLDRDKKLEEREHERFLEEELKEEYREEERIESPPESYSGNSWSLHIRDGPAIYAS